MKNFLMFLFLSSAVTFSSCKKGIPADKLNYVGLWWGDYTELTINADGTGSYIYDDGILSKYITGGKVKITDNKLSIHLGIFKKKYDITKGPYTDSGGDVVIELDGELFYKF